MRKGTSSLTYIDPRVLSLSSSDPPLCPGNTGTGKSYPASRSVKCRSGNPEYLYTDVIALKNVSGCEQIWVCIGKIKDIVKDGQNDLLLFKCVQSWFVVVILLEIQV